MDKYEFQIKTEQLGKLIKKEDYKTAAKIADSIDWRKVRNVGLLLQVAEAYEKTERYEDCYEILNIAYDCAPIGRMIVYKMVEIAVKLKDFDEAVELYKEFVRIAPHDLGRYVLKYEIYKGRGSSIEDQIAILEEYKSREYQEEWAYELAELYYKAGMSLKCVEECDDLILWFSEGEYVIKAMELKMRIQPLTASQEEKYRQMVTDPRTAEEIKVRPVNMEQFNTTNLQAALAEGLEDLIRKETERKAEAPEGQGVSGQKGTPEKQETSKQQEAPEETSAPDKAEGARDRGSSAAPAAGQGTAVSWSGASKDTMQLPKFIGQDESGQLTFDMEENVLDRQITGQLSIEDILNDWEVKKRETEAAIAEAAKRDEERRRERERLRATGQLPELNIEVKTTVPEEIQRLIEEIEGRYPVHVELEPIRKKTAESGRQQEKEELGGDTLQKAVPSSAPAAKEPQEILEILEILEAPAESKGQKRMDSREILDILEAASLEELQPAAGQKPEEQPASQKRAEDDARRKAETEQEKEEEPAAPMLEELEKSLEETISAIPPGQLSEEQKKLFAYFTSVRGMNRQLAELLEEDRMRKERREDSLVGNIVITGERGNGKSTLAADIVKALQKQRRVKGAKMAKVAAESLNGKDVSAVVAKLGGGALLIERAGNLKTKTAVQLSHAMTRKTGGLLVILEDDKEEIRKLFIRCESLGAKFTRTIEIPVFTNKELVAFGESYAQERDCVLDEMAVLALYNRIGNNQTSDHLVNVAEVKEMVDEAIEKRGKKGLFGKTKKSRMDEFGHLILLEKDFEK